MVRKVTQKSNNRRRRRGARRHSLRRLPLRFLWVLVAVATCAYGIYLYKTFIGPHSFHWMSQQTDNVQYPQGTVRGIDISHYQRDIDWKQLRNATIHDAPLSFVFIKATEGTDRFDPDFNYNFATARRNGITRGAYHFFSITSSAKQQAEYFCHMVQLEPGDLPPVLDVETDVDNVADYTRTELRKEVKKWLEIVERHYGVKPILYASHAFKMHYLDGPEFDSYPYWIAHYYIKNLNYNGHWTFWQHTDIGHVAGIEGNVDIDVFNGTAEAFQALLIPDTLD